MVAFRLKKNKPARVLSVRGPDFSVPPVERRWRIFSYFFKYMYMYYNVQ